MTKIFLNVNLITCQITLNNVIVRYLLALPFYWYLKGKIEKVPRGIRGEKSSKDMASSRNLVSTIGAFASPKNKAVNFTYLILQVQ